MLFDQQTKLNYWLPRTFRNKNVPFFQSQTVTLLIHSVLLIDLTVSLVSTLHPVLRNRGKLIQEDTARASVYWKAQAMGLKTWIVCYSRLARGITQTLFKAQTKTSKKRPRL